MKTKHTLLLALLLSFSFFGRSQGLSDVNLRISNDKTTVRSIELYAGNIIIKVSQKGNVKLNAVAGTQYAYSDPFNDSQNNKFRMLDNMLIDYYDDFEESRAGKIKSIGSIAVTYYDKFDGFENIGRVKSIGAPKFIYYSKYDGFDNMGKLKSVGSINIAYYDRYDGDDLNGKLKSVGNTLIIYYDRYDGPFKNGKIKSITGKTPHLTISNLSADILADNDTF